MSGLFRLSWTRALTTVAVACGAGFMPSSALAQNPRETKSPSDGHVENFGRPAVDLLRKATRVEVSTVFDNGRRFNSEVVILVSEQDDQPYMILSWNDVDFDPNAGVR